MSHVNKGVHNKRKFRKIWWRWRGGMADYGIH